MNKLGYDTSFTSDDYSYGSPAALGNYIGQQLIKFGLQDGANEAEDYTNQHYQSQNTPLEVDKSGNPKINDPNKWQPLTLSLFIDQSGNITGNNTPEFHSPYWGNVIPF